METRNFFWKIPETIEGKIINAKREGLQTRKTDKKTDEEWGGASSFYMECHARREWQLITIFHDKKDSSSFYFLSECQWKEGYRGQKTEWWLDSEVIRAGADQVYMLLIPRDK